MDGGFAEAQGLAHPGAVGLDGASRPVILQIATGRQVQLGCQLLDDNQGNSFALSFVIFRNKVYYEGKHQVLIAAE